MLLTVSEFREAVQTNRPALIMALRSETGRGGQEEREAWESSLPALANALAAPGLAGLHLYFVGHGYLALEYQLPAASSWCDVVLLGRGEAGPSAVIVELKHWITRGDRPGPAEGLMHRGGELVLHPADQGDATDGERLERLFLDCKTAKLDALIAKIRDAFDRLQELRTALIPPPSPARLTSAPNKI